MLLNSDLRLNLRKKYLSIRFISKRSLVFENPFHYLMISLKHAGKSNEGKNDGPKNANIMDVLLTRASKLGRVSCKLFNSIQNAELSFSYINILCFIHNIIIRYYCDSLIPFLFYSRKKSRLGSSPPHTVSTQT